MYKSIVVKIRKALQELIVAVKTDLYLASTTCVSWLRSKLLQ